MLWMLHCINRVKGKWPRAPLTHAPQPPLANVPKSPLNAPCPQVKPEKVVWGIL